MILKTIKAILLVTSVSYFFAMAFKMLLDIQADFFDWDNYTDDPYQLNDPNQSADDHFMTYFEMEGMKDYDNLVVMFYYSFTTLTTVGFGDFHPRSNAERLFIALGMLGGVATFSLFMAELIEIV